MRKILSFCKAQPVLVISFILAVLTMFLIPPDKEYFSYCNTTVLIELFALMIAVAGLASTGIFDKLTAFLLQKAGTIRRLGIMLILICFFSAMLVTNDVALLTFVPLTLLAFKHISNEKAKIFIIVLETAAANMGSMMTPVGNPQNLYLYDRYHLTAMSFLQTMLWAGLVSLGILLLLTFVLSANSCQIEEQKQITTDNKFALIYGGLFCFCLLTVFRIVPPWICLFISILTAGVLNRKLFLKVDYALLGSFLCFFVFVGNLSRIEAVQNFFSEIMEGREILTAVLLSQVISNVPAAVMLSGFTENGTALLLGVNLGGLGTLIASMASLISYQIYGKEKNSQSGKYLLTFTGVSILMLTILLGMQFLKEQIF